MFRKGIAPLVATLILISFAIALGVTIMSFGRAQVELEASCPIDIGFEFSDEKQLCYNPVSKEVVFTVMNGINIKVEGIIVNVIGDQKAETFDLGNAKMERGGTYSGRTPFDGTVRQIKLTPKVIFYEEEEICTKKALVIEDVKNC